MINVTKGVRCSSKANYQKATIQLCGKRAEI